MSNNPNSYRVALKSSSIIAGSSVIALFFNIVRAKVLAVVIGPAGVGLFATYLAVVTLLTTFAGMGIPTSGVRQIAEANTYEASRRLDAATKALRYSAVVLGSIGAGILYLCSDVLSTLTFSGSHDYSTALALLSAAVLFTCISQGQGALLQGKRLIRELAASRILSSAAGTGVTVLAVVVLDDNEIVVAIIAASLVTVLCNWIFTRRVHALSPVTKSNVWEQTQPMLRLGVVFMASSLMLTGSMFVQRAIIVRQLGLDDVGFYQAAYALSVVYVGFILSAMGADFLPRLTAVANDHDSCNRLVNEQAEVSLLLAAPGIVATYSLAPVVILLFYSSAFTPAVEVLRWQILGVLGQVITWPMGFILVAKNRSSLVFLTNFVFSIIHLVLFWFAIPVFGLAGTGMAFALVHVYQFVVLSKVCVSISGFRWSRSNKQLLLLMIASLLITVLTTWLLPHWLGILGGCIVATAFSCYSLQKLTSLAGVNSVAAYVTRRIKKLKTAKIPIGREG